MKFQQIKSIINNKKIESNFSLFYSKLTLLRLDDDNESSKKYELLVQLLKSVENKDNIDEEVTRGNFRF